ncbi:PAS domain-containing sensor histidine kinase [bacterium]|nr:MAG: PAS domain-containing sensor histidine kinase [bacterium]
MPPGGADPLRIAPETLFAGLLSHTRLVVYLKDLSGRYLFVNKRYEELSGAPAAFIIGKTDRDLFPPEVAGLFAAQDAAVAAKGAPAEFEETIPLPGGVFSFITEKFPLKDADGRIWAVGGFCTETTLQQRRAEESLAAERERARVTLRCIGDGVVSADTDGVVLTVNPAAEGMLGRSGGELVGRSLAEVLPPSAGDPPRLTIPRGDGSRCVCHVRTAPVADRNGLPVGSVVSMRDMTAVEAAHEALDGALRRTRTIMKAIPDIFYLLDADMRLADWNEVLETVSGLTPAQLRGRHALEFFKSDKDVAAEGIADAVSRGQTLREARFLTGDGREIPYFWSAAALRDAEGKLLGLVGVGRDITEAKREEAGRLTVQKLESLGLLAGGIAHDFNNLLTGIIGNISLLAGSAGLAPEDRDVVAATLRASSKAKNLTLQLLTFAKGGAPQKKTLAVGPLLREAADFVGRGSSVRCDLCVEDGLPLVEADEGQLSQVVHNLIINARQAMPAGGVVSVSARTAELKAGEVRGLRAGPAVRIDVTDRGHGIPEEHLGRIFDPYFTTKREGRGLGLATSRSIVEMHGGAMSVFSRPGEGATFTIHLPASSSTEAPPPAPSPASPAEGSGRILVMDDEEEVVKVLERILRKLGYRPESVFDGETAVAAYRKALAGGEPYRAVVMDLTIPGGMGGRAAAARILAVDPAAKLIVSSGYSNDDTLSDYALHGFSGSLSKPYSVYEVAEALTRVLAVSRRG